MSLILHMRASHVTQLIYIRFCIRSHKNSLVSDCETTPSAWISCDSCHKETMAGFAVIHVNIQGSNSSHRRNVPHGNIFRTTTPPDDCKSDILSHSHVHTPHPVLSMSGVVFQVVIYKSIRRVLLTKAHTKGLRRGFPLGFWYCYPSCEKYP